MRRLTLLLPAVLMAGCPPSFDAFQVVPPDGSAPSDARMDASDASPPMDGGPDAKPPTDGGPDDAPLDASPDAAFVAGPVDFECSVPWIDLAGDDPDGCGGRSIHPVAEDLTVVSDVAVARTGSGRVAVAYNSMEFADRGSLEIRVLDEASKAELDRETIDPTAMMGETVGTAIALEAGVRETFHLVYWLRSDFGSEVLYRRLREDGLLTDAEAVDTSVSRTGTVDLVVVSNGDVHAAWHDDGSGLHRTRMRRGSDGEWLDPFDLDEDLDTRSPGPGAIAIAAGAGDTVHVAYRWSPGPFNTIPRYRVLAGGSWSIRTTIDNNAGDRQSGVGIDLTVFGDERAAAYVDWVDSTAEIRLAEWTEGGEIGVGVLVPGLSLEMRPPVYPLAMRVDGRGLLHLLVLHVMSTGSLLEYRRQTPSGTGERWLRDVVATDLPAEPYDTVVDLDVDESRRPHIVWFAGGDVHYATIDPEAMP